MTNRRFQRVSARRNYELTSGKGDDGFCVSSVSLHVGIMNLSAMLCKY